MPAEADEGKVLDMLLARAAKLIADEAWNTNWGVISAQFGFGHLLEQNSRLLTAQSWGDEDYVSEVLWLVREAYDEDPQMCLAMLREVIDTEDVRIRRNHEEVVEFLDGANTEDIDIIADLPSVPNTFRYIDVDNLPDDFYDELVSQINKSYRHGLYPSLLILVRKLLENLIIDLLGKKYGAKDFTKFYDKDRGRFHDFAYLLEELETNLSDFQTASAELDVDFIRRLQEHRKTGNSSAHSIDVFVEKGTIDDKRTGINHAVKLLSRTIDQVHPKR